MIALCHPTTWWIDAANALGLIVEITVVKDLLIGSLAPQLPQDRRLFQSFTTTVVHYPYWTYPQHSIYHTSNTFLSLSTHYTRHTPSI